jgi:ribosomal protein L18E
MYDEYGPTPRICFNYLRNMQSLQIHQLRYTKALANLSIEELRKMAQDATALTMDDMSHTLLLMKRMSKEVKVHTTLEVLPDEDLVLVKVELVSREVEMALQVRLWEEL